MPPSTTGKFQSYKNTAYLVGDTTAASDRSGALTAHYVQSQAGSCTRVQRGLHHRRPGGQQDSRSAPPTTSAAAPTSSPSSDQMKNGKSARFAANDFGAVNPGEDTKHLIAGIAHRF